MIVHSIEQNLHPQKSGIAIATPNKPKSSNWLRNYSTSSLHHSSKKQSNQEHKPLKLHPKLNPTNGFEGIRPKSLNNSPKKVSIYFKDEFVPYNTLNHDRGSTACPLKLQSITIKKKHSQMQAPPPTKKLFKRSLKENKFGPEHEVTRGGFKIERWEQKSDDCPFSFLLNRSGL